MREDKFDCGCKQLAIKDAEIAELKTRLSGRTCFIPPEFQKQLDDSQAEIARLKSEIETLELAALDECKLIASRDLMINELRDDMDKIHSFVKEVPSLQLLIAVSSNALSKSEHHNSRALEKMLLEARIDALEEVNGLESWVIDREIADYKTELAELNKE